MINISNIYLHKFNENATIKPFFWCSSSLKTFIK